MMDIVFATGNKGKLKEAQEIFKEFKVISIFEFTDAFEPHETGSTFMENAVIKAEAANKIVKDHWVLADDSGLVVKSLNGAPGIFSSRFGGEHGNDALNRKTLHDKMAGIEERAAYFTCVAVLLMPDYTALVTEGKCRGIIGFEEKGKNGFGYDPLFVPDGFARTIAELDSSTKNAISHRGEAFRKMENMLKCFQNSKG